MNSVEEPVDFDRLMLKANTLAHSHTNRTASPRIQDPLELIRSLTAQFKTHFTQIKNDLSQRVQKSARQMEQYEVTKKELKEEEKNDPYQSIPSIPIQVYDWRHQRLEGSPKKTSKEEKTKSTRVPQKQQSFQKEVVVKKSVTYKQPKQMERYAYTKRYQKYLDQKYYKDIPIIVKNELGQRIRQMKEDGNILGAHSELNKEEQEKFRQCESILMDKEISAFTTGNGKLLKFVKKYEYEYRKQAFVKMMEIGKTTARVTKNSLVRYLFDHVVMMMLYSINPYELVEEIANFICETPNELNFVQLSNFLLTPREPPSPQSYSEHNITQAEMSSFGEGQVVEPVIPYVTWLDADETVEQILKCFEYVDIFGKRKVQTQDLIIKLKKYSAQQGILGKQIMFITEIGKPISLQRLLYEIQFQNPRRKEWTYDSFTEFFYDYRKLTTLPREQIIQNQMVEGILDWTLLINTSVLAVLRQVYNSSRKYSDNYVDKVAYLDLVYSSISFDKIKGFEVRRAPYMDVGLETVEETLARIYYEADEYLDIDQIVDFFTNRGRPFLIQDKIRNRNSELQLLKIQYEEMERQNQDTKDSEDEDIEYSILRQQYKRQQFKVRQAKTNQIKQKIKKITIPVPFDFKESKQQTIRQRKLNQMLMEKELKIQEELKPIAVAKQVPWYVKQNLYERFKMQQDSLRRRRLEAFKTHLLAHMNPPPDRLLQKPPRGQLSNQVVDKYEFVARPFPWYCQIELLDRINRQKLERRERIQKEIEEREFEDGTPQGVKNMLERQKILKQKWNLKNKDKRVQSQDKIKPFKVKKVPDFKRIFEQNGIELQVRDLRPKEQPHIETWEEHRKKRVSFKDEPEVAPPPAKTTLKTEALAELRRKQRLQELIKKQRQEEEDNDRYLRQQKLAPKVKSVLKRMKIEHDAQLQRFQKQKDHDRKKQEEERKKWYEQTVYQAYKKVVEDRPLLIETMNPPKIPSYDMIEEVEKNPIKSKPKTQSKKIRQGPIKRVLHRTDNRIKNLEQRHPQKEQDYDDDQYEEQFEEEEESESYQDYQKHSAERQYLEKQRADYEQQLMRQQHRMLNQQEDYQYQDDDDDDDQYQHQIKNRSF